MSFSLRAGRRIRAGLISLLLMLGALPMLFPLVWMISASLKTPDQFTSTQINLVPHPIAWRNYGEMAEMAPIVLHLRNTMTILICAEFGSLIVCSLVAYAFAQVPFPGRDLMFGLLLSSMMLPGVVTLVPFFVIFDRLGWINTFLPLIVPRLLAHNPFYIFLMRQFFRGIPRDPFDAARIDGASAFGVWWRIVLPVSQPVQAAVAIFTFQWVSNDFLHPLVYLGGDKDLWTLALGLNYVKGMITEEPTLHYQMAYAFLMLLPLVAVFAVGQQYFVEGVVFTGLKG